jgi:protein involved in polysaccharide export with SLBB domain
MYPALLVPSLLLLVGGGVAGESKVEMTFGQRYALTPEQSPPADITGTAQVAFSKDSSAVYAPGDRIKIAAFEVFGRASGSGDALINGLVERPELSTEYTIQQDGFLVLPFVGLVRAAGQTQRQVERALEDDYLKVLGAKLKIAIHLLEREPIYVTGAQMKPTTVKYVPGMIVLKALALSGSQDRISADSWFRVDLSRERERMRKSQEHMKACLARLQVLLAEQEGKQAHPSGELLKVSSNEEAKARIADEVRLREMELKDIAVQADARLSTMQMTTNELTLLREQVGESERAMKEIAEWVKMLEEARGQGNLREPTLHQARSELYAVRAHWHNLQVAIAQTERKVRELDQENRRSVVEAEIQRYREIRELMKQLVEEDLTQASIEPLIQSSARIRPSDPDHDMLTIIRRGPAGFVNIGADAFSALQPGDILQVGGPAFQVKDLLSSINH